MGSSPFLQVWPKLRERFLEFLSFADEDGQIFFECIRIVGRVADEFDILKELFEAFPSIVENDEAIA